MRETVTLPEDVTFDELRKCTRCFASRLEFVPEEFVAALEQSVVEPLRVMQRLIDRHGYATRLYSTLSAAEMTEDPLFTFNPNLPEVNNFHYARRTVECGMGNEGATARWRLKLPQGPIVRGEGLQWPLSDDLAPNARVLRLSDSGSGVVVLDNRAEIKGQISESNRNYPPVPDDLGSCAVSRTASEAGNAPWLALLGASFGWLRRRARRASAHSAQR